MRTLFQLSPAKVRNAGVGWHADGGNLYLQVSKAGTKSWSFRYVLAGKEHWMGLGSLNTISIADARAAALEARKLLVAGIDPLAEKRARRASAALANAKGTTFDEAVRAYIASHETGWKNARHREQWVQSVADYASPTIGNIAVTAIDTELVLRVLRPIWTAKPETARRLRARIEAVLNFSIEDAALANPARWKGHLEYKLDKRARKAAGVKPHAALPYAEIGAFMAKVRERDDVGARALEFAILTATRTNEVVGARWSEIDLHAKTWTIPGSRMKAGKEHRVALSDAALAALGPAQGSGLIFLGLKRHAALRIALHKIRDDITVHGFRSTFRTWAAECTSVPNAVIEMALAHTVGTQVERAYQRSDLLDHRRPLMDQWAEYCSRPAPAGTVLTLRPR